MPGAPPPRSAEVSLSGLGELFLFKITDFVATGYPHCVSGSSHVAALAFPDNYCIISTNILSKACRRATPLPPPTQCSPPPWLIIPPWLPCPNKAENTRKFLKSRLATGAWESLPTALSDPVRAAQSGWAPQTGAGPQPCASRRGGAAGPPRSHCPRSPAPPRSVPPYLWRTRASSERRAPGWGCSSSCCGGGGGRAGAARGGAGRRGGGPGARQPGRQRAGCERGEQREEREHQHGGASTPAAGLLLPHRRGREPPAGRLPGPAALLSPGRGSGTRSARAAVLALRPPRPPSRFLLGNCRNL